jgi:hypothetical protein
LTAVEELAALAILCELVQRQAGKELDDRFVDGGSSGPLRTCARKKARKDEDGVAAAGVAVEREDEKKREITQVAVGTSGGT